MDPNAPPPAPIPQTPPAAAESSVPVASFRTPDQVALHRNRSHERGQRLVGQSTMLFAISALVLFGGCGAGVALKITAVSIAAVVLGIVLLVVSAVVGTVGRALQGRVL
ncbi:MAG: hypothetical protein HOO96_21955 [Polyangiaceae bacterium]|nr:hypothetical protein [Polyangiaceae bacterium]